MMLKILGKNESITFLIFRVSLKKILILVFIAVVIGVLIFMFVMKVPDSVVCT